MTEFDDDTAVRRTAGVWEGTVPQRRWNAGLGPNGGFIAAIVLRAIEAEAGDPSLHPRTLTVHYLRRPAPGPLEVAVNAERIGRQVASYSVRATQDGEPVVTALASLSRPWPVAHELRTPPPDVPPVGELSVGGGVDVEGLPAIVGRLRFAVAIGGQPFSGGDAVAGGWLALAQPRIPDAAQLALFADGWPPALFVNATEQIAVPTIELTVHFRAALPHPGLGAEDFLLCRFQTRTAAEGFAEEDGEIWAPDGTLLAQSRQLALVRGRD